MAGIKEDIEIKISMIEDDIQAYIYDARFDNGFFTDYHDEF